MEEEARTFVKVVQATDPQAPCPKCVTEDHNVCSTSLRSVVVVAPTLRSKTALCLSPITHYHAQRRGRRVRGGGGARRLDDRPRGEFGRSL